jgi:hypothetical protein
MTRIRHVMLALCCVCAAPSLALAQDDAFKQGLEARGDRKWADVVRHMQNAVKVDDKESSRKVRSGFIGLQSTEYLPHYFLGEAFFNQGDCAGAVAEWSISDQQGAVKSRPEFLANLRKNLQTCASKGVLLAPEFATLHQSTLRAYTDATTLAKRVSDMGTTHKDVWRADADEQFARARKELESSLSRLTAGQRSRLASDFNESKAAADRAVGILRPLENSLNAAVVALSSVARLSKEVEQALTGADAANDAIESLKAPLTDAMQNARKSGREQLAQARDRLAAGQKTQNPAALGEALKYAQSASTTLTQVLDQVKKAARSVFEQQLGEAIRGADEAFARISAAITTLDRRAAQTPDLVRPETATARETLEKQIDTLRRRFERARKAEDLASLTETTRLAGETQLGLDALIKAFGPLSLRDRGIDGALEEGARHYLDGEYQKALTALEPLIGRTDVPMQLHAHVFRAASLYALYVRSGESNEQLRTQALAEIAQSKQLNSSFLPSSRAFSPRFISFYQTGGAASSPAADGAAPQQ